MAGTHRVVLMIPALGFRKKKKKHIFHIAPMVPGRKSYLMVS